MTIKIGEIRRVLEEYPGTIITGTYEDAAGNCCPLAVLANAIGAQGWQGWEIDAHYNLTSDHRTHIVDVSDAAGGGPTSVAAVMTYLDGQRAK